MSLFTLINRHVFYDDSTWRLPNRSDVWTVPLSSPPRNFSPDLINHNLVVEIVQLPNFSFDAVEKDSETLKPKKNLNRTQLKALTTAERGRLETNAYTVESIEDLRNAVSYLFAPLVKMSHLQDRS